MKYIGKIPESRWRRWAVFGNNDALLGGKIPWAEMSSRSVQAIPDLLLSWSVSYLRAHMERMHVYDRAPVLLQPRVFVSVTFQIMCQWLFLKDYAALENKQLLPVRGKVPSLKNVNNSPLQVLPGASFLSRQDFMFFDRHEPLWDMRQAFSFIVQNAANSVYYVYFF